jgi:hypothetical protein
VYSYASAINVTKADTKVIGLGFGTIIPTNGNDTITVADVPGVNISGLILDAGPVNSPALLQIGATGFTANNASDPVTVDDVSFRIGGAEAGSATTAFIDDSNNSIIDDVWAWRADHGNDVGWTADVATTGVEVTGDDVTAYGLAVEHYQKTEVSWTGQGGTDVFVQNELSYDPPSQAAWRQSAAEDGYPAFQVGAGVKTFQGYGTGSYVVFIDTSATLHDAAAFAALKVPGIAFHDVFGVWIAGSGGLNSVINGVGGPVTSTHPGKVVPVDVASYRP